MFLNDYKGLGRQFGLGNNGNNAEAFFIYVSPKIYGDELEHFGLALLPLLPYPMLYSIIIYI